MAENYGAVSVATTATKIISANSGRRNLTIVNNGTADIFIGPDASVTTSNGVTLFGGSTRDQDIVPEGYKGDVYGICESGNVNVRYWESTTEA